jgi:NifU-like protein involved in Fe-S cluster formation
VYSKTAMDHFLRPRNVGEVAGGISGEAMNPDCGDTVVVSLAVVGGVIMDARFRSKGCSGAIAASSAVTELIRGRPVSVAAAVTAEAICDHLGGLPDAKLGCAGMAAEAARTAAKKAGV